MIDQFINKIHQGNSLDILKQMPDNSVDSVITSPPYWQLRDYGYPDQWGLEPTYQEYLEHLWLLMDETYRILKPTGTAWINLGDTYSRGGRTNINLPNNLRKVKVSPNTKPQYDSDKCLLLIPHRFAIGCIDRGWIVRNDIIWAKRNGMPESVTDRFSKKHEYIFFMAKQPKYYFDLDGIREKIISQSKTKILQPYNSKYNEQKKGNAKSLSQIRQQKRMMGLPEGHINGKNPGDVSDFWDINTKGISEKHYASYNFKLIEKPIIAGCPEFVCKKCGKPREKIIEKESYDYSKSKRQITNVPNRSESRHNTAEKPTLKRKIIGLTDCGCNVGFEGGIILDPFCGVGTTLIRTLQLNRRIIGIDGSKEYCEIARKKISVELNQLKLEY